MPIKTTLPDLTHPTSQAQNHITAKWGFKMSQWGFKISQWGFKISQFTGAKWDFPIHCSPYRRSEGTKFSFSPTDSSRESWEFPILLCPLTSLTASVAPELRHCPSQVCQDCSEWPGKFSTGFWTITIIQTGVQWDILYYHNSNSMQNIICSGNSQPKRSSFVILK